MIMPDAIAAGPSSCQLGNGDQLTACNQQVPCNWYSLTAKKLMVCDRVV